MRLCDLTKNIQFIFPSDCDAVSVRSLSTLINGNSVILEVRVSFPNALFIFQLSARTRPEMSDDRTQSDRLCGLFS